MTTLFGAKYFGFIASSYGITFVVLFAVIIWIMAIYRHRKLSLKKLEEAGIRRASRNS